MLLAPFINSCKPISEGITRFFTGYVLTGFLEKRADSFSEFVASLDQSTATAVQHVASRLHFFQLRAQRFKFDGFRGNLRVGLKRLALLVEFLFFGIQV